MTCRSNCKCRCNEPMCGCKDREHPFVPHREPHLAEVELKRIVERDQREDEAS